MNPTIDTIFNRKSVRAYTDQPVDDNTRKTIIDAALRSPTAGNQMLYSIIEVTSQHTKDRLVVTCDNQPFIAKAPLVLLFLADYQRWVDYFNAGDIETFCAAQDLAERTPEKGDLFLACCDALIAAQTSVLAAESLGLGSCYIGDIMENYEIHKELFDLPAHVFPITMVCYGYPTATQKKRALTDRFDESDAGITAAHGLEHHPRSLRLLPQLRHQGDRSQLGQCPVECTDGLLAGQLVVGVLPGHGHRPDGHRHQLHRRRPARCAGSARARIKFATDEHR